MSVTFAALTGRLGLDVSGWTSGVSAAVSSFNQMRSHTAAAANAIKQTISQVGSSFRELGSAVAGAAAAAVATTAGVGGTLVKLASDAEEAASKFKFVFSEAADETRDAIDKFAKAAGRSKYELRNMAADIGALVGPMGFTKKETGDLSVQVSKLATDLSSFFNISESDALTALRSGIVGESEPLRRLGVQLNEAKIQSEAFALGLAKSKDEITPMIKTQSIMSIVMRETAQAQGDAVRTAGGYANQIRALAGTSKDAATDIGFALLPAATATIEVFRGWISTTGNLTESIKQFITENLSIERVKQFWADVGEAAESVAVSFRRTWTAASRLLNVFDGLGDRVSDIRQRFRDWYSELPQGTQDLLKIAGVLSGLSLALGALGSLPFVGPLLTAVTALINPFKLLGIAASAAWAIISGGFAIVGPVLLAIKAAVLGLGGVLAGISAPVWAIIAAIGVLGTAVYLAATKTEVGRKIWESIKATFISLGEAIWAFLKQTWDVLVRTFEANRENFLAIGEGLKALAVIVGTVLLAQWKLMVDAMSATAKVVLPILGKAVEGLGIMFGWLTSVLAFAADMLTGNWTSAINRVLTLLLAVTETVEGLGIAFLESIGIQAPAAIVELSNKLRNMVAENDAILNRQKQKKAEIEKQQAAERTSEGPQEPGFLDKFKKSAGDLFGNLFGGGQPAAAEPATGGEPVPTDGQSPAVPAGGESAMSGSSAAGGAKPGPTAKSLKEAEKAKKDLEKATKTLTESLKEEIATFGMDAAAKERWKLSQKGATKETLNEIKAMQDRAARMKNAKKNDRSFVGMSLAVRDAGKDTADDSSDDSGKLGSALHARFQKVQAFTEAKAGKFTKEKADHLRELVATEHANFNQLIQEAGDNGATRAQQKELGLLKREIIGTMQTAATATGDMKAAAVQRLIELQAAWNRTFEAAGKKTKEELAKVRANVDKEMGAVKKVVGDAGKQIAAAASGSGSSSRPGTSRGNLLGGLLDSGPARQFAGALRGIQSAFGGVMAAGRNFAAAVAAQTNPIARINLQIAKLRGELSGMEANAMKWKSGPSTLAAMDSTRRQIAGLSKERDRLEAEAKAAALAFFRRQQASKRQSEARRAEEGALVDAVPIKTGGRAPSGSRFDAAGGPPGVIGADAKSVSNQTANVTNNFSGVLTPDMSKKIAAAVDSEFNRMGYDGFNRSIARGRRNRG